MGDEVRSCTKWEPVEDEENKEAFGYKVERQRTVDTYLKIEGIPFADHSETKSQFYDVNRTDTRIIVKSTAHSKGIPYAEAFITNTKWEVYAPFKGSKKVVFAHSFKIVWNYKPFLVSGIIANSIRKKVNSAGPGVRNFYINSAKDYNTLETVKQNSDSANVQAMLQDMMDENKRRTVELQK